MHPSVHMIFIGKALVMHNQVEVVPHKAGLKVLTRFA